MCCSRFDIASFVAPGTCPLELTHAHQFGSFPVYYIDVDISVIFALFHAHHALVAQNPGCVTVQ